MKNMKCQTESKLQLLWLLSLSTFNAPLAILSFLHSLEALFCYLSSFTASLCFFFILQMMNDPFNFFLISCPKSLTNSCFLNEKKESSSKCQIEYFLWTTPTQSSLLSNMLTSTASLSIWILNPKLVFASRVLSKFIIICQSALCTTNDKNHMTLTATVRSILPAVNHYFAKERYLRLFCLVHRTLAKADCNPNSPLKLRIALNTTLSLSKKGNYFKYPKSVTIEDWWLFVFSSLSTSFTGKLRNSCHLKYLSCIRLS